VALLILGLSIGVTLVKTRTRLGSQAAITAPACNSILTISASPDGSVFSSNIALPAGTPTKYYVKTYANSRACSSNFDVYYRKCDGAGRNCQSWQTVRNWGTYKPNIYGIFRADLDDPWPDNLMMQMKLRPAGKTNIPWSNQVNISFSGQTPGESVPPDMQNMRDFIKMVPGWTYIFNSKNNLTGGQTGTTRLQIEQPVSICGINMYPWRFTKDSSYTYWHPVIPNSQFDGRQDLRWFIVDPAFNYTPIPALNNYIWGFNYIFYNRWPDNLGVVAPIQDIQFGGLIKSGLFQVTSNQAPHYNLSLKEIKQYPYIKKVQTALKQSGDPLPGCSLFNPDATGTWKVRVEAENISISNNEPDSYNYTGPAVRVDYYEGQTDLENKDLIRESYYYVKNVGVVKIIGKVFNDYGGSGVRNCKDDSDCWDDTIRNPDFTSTLRQIYQNPALSVQVSTDGVHYSNSITTTQANGYWLKVSPAYTGYLEAYGNPAFRWLWAENGVVRVPNPYAPGTYNSKFRVWIPNELGPGETAGSGQVSLPWSNTIRVAVNASADATCTTSTWYTGYNYSGNNWCPANNQFCATDWIASPRVPVNCGSQRLQNIGTYCTKPDDTKSFTGRSSCVN
jgi:hypothetical protein